MSFNVGDKVVCIDSKPNPNLSPSVPLKLVEGQTYTVSAIIRPADTIEMVVLDVLEAPCGPPRMVTTSNGSYGIAYGYGGFRFRKVVEKKTNESIAQWTSVFTKTEEFA